MSIPTGTRSAGPRTRHSVPAALPLGIICTLSAKTLGRRRSTLIGIGSAGRRLLLGLATILIGVMILSGADHMIETYLTQVSPVRLVDLTAHY